MAHGGTNRGLAWCPLLLGVCLVGCGPEPHHAVRGTVTLDGRPLPGAFISFMPEGERGAPSLGTTDDQGRYELTHGIDLKGAPVGTYRVRISTHRQARDDTDPPMIGVRERVPMKYNLNSDLLREVEAGENVFDFELDSRGEIFQPDS